MAIPSVPDQIDSDPINVQEKKIRQVDCPNPDCDGVLDITNMNIGTKIRCKACKNVTWLPDYSKRWWQKPGAIIGGLLISFIIGVLSSLTASWIQDRNTRHAKAETKESANDGANKALQDTAGGRGQ